jgi:phospholipid-binding lipoprotein MlaA
MRNLNMTISKYIASFFCVSVSLFLVSCASESYEKTGVVHDPLENINRTTLKINDAADKAILEPIAKGYRKATPQWSRTVVSNFLRNPNSPVVIGNQILQGDVEGTANATARVIINTLAGFGGILDLAEEGGIPHEQEDFGQTLAKWGFGDGMYVMLPLLGPSNVRDATGSLVDSYADPLRIYLFNIDEEHLHYTRIAANVVSQREQLIEVINDLRRNSFDYYAAIRSAYYQSRQSLINDGAVGNYPDFDEF